MQLRYSSGPPYICQWLHSSYLLLRDCNSNWLSDCLLHGVTIGFWPCSSLFDSSSISFLDDASEPTQTSANLYRLKINKIKCKKYRDYGGCTFACHLRLRLNFKSKCFQKLTTRTNILTFSLFISCKDKRKPYPLDCPLALFSKNLISSTSVIPTDRMASVRSSSVVHCVETKQHYFKLQACFENKTFFFLHGMKSHWCACYLPMWGFLCIGQSFCPCRCTPH